MFCRVTGCGQRPTKYGTLCNLHKGTDRRHGDPKQKGVTAPMLKPYLKTAHELIRRNDSNELWSILNRQWQELGAAARQYHDMYLAGQPGLRIERMAYSEIGKIERDVPPRIVVETVLAMYLMQEAEPRRFQSDRAFRFQLVRRVRRLTDINVGEYWNQDTGKVKRVYRDMPPRATDICAAKIVDALGFPCLCLAQRCTKEHREQTEANQRARQRLNDALTAVH